MNRNELQQGCADILKSLRLEAGLSVSRMADLVDIDKRTWQKYEDGFSAPTVPEFVQIYQRLGKSALFSCLQLVYPSIYSGLTKDSSVSELRSALVHYFDKVASEEIVRQMDYIIFSEHGSNFVPQLQEWTALDHLPMAFRYSIAKQIVVFWELAKANNQLVGLDHVMPDIDIFLDAIIKGEEAALHGRNSYTTGID